MLLVGSHSIPAQYISNNNFTSTHHLLYTNHSKKPWVQNLLYDAISIIVYGVIGEIMKLF
jgi:hypothetical protein